MYMTPEKMNKKYAKSYKQGLTTVPNPDVLETNYEQYKEKDGSLDLDAWSRMSNRNEVVINGWEDKAVKDRKWVGRTLMDGVGDGNAIYVVIKENKKSVRIKVCRGMGDDWVSRHFGEECSINKLEALSFMDHGGIFGDGKKKRYPYDIVDK